MYIVYIYSMCIYIYIIVCTYSIYIYMYVCRKYIVHIYIYTYNVVFVVYSKHIVYILTKYDVLNNWGFSRKMVGIWWMGSFFTTYWTVDGRRNPINHQKDGWNRWKTINNRINRIHDKTIYKDWCRTSSTGPAVSLIDFNYNWLVVWNILVLLSGWTRGRPGQDVSANKKVQEVALRIPPRYPSDWRDQWENGSRVALF
jgi:hypothetical protein